MENYILNSKPTVSTNVCIRGSSGKNGDLAASFKPNSKGKLNASQHRLRSQNAESNDDSDDENADSD